MMYYLSKDCSVCRIGRYWIILSTARDRYLCVEHANLAAIGDQLAGWNDEHCVSTHRSLLATDDLVESLISRRIITSNPLLGKPFVECQYLAPESRLEASPTVQRRNISFLAKVRFFISCAVVDWRLRRKALPRLLDRIERRRFRVKVSTPNRTPEHTPTLVAAFNALRPLYPRSYVCLFDSLALLEFLARYKCFPRVVFGVAADPFQAHCWLQDGSAVLDDDLERVRRYKPILSA